MTKNPVANPVMVLREEFDDWAVLFNPDNGETFGMNPVSVFIWRLLNGKHSIEEVCQQVRLNCNNVPPEAEEQIKTFVNNLTEKGFVGYEA